MADAPSRSRWPWRSASAGCMTGQAPGRAAAGWLRHPRAGPLGRAAMPGSLRTAAPAPARPVPWKLGHVGGGSPAARGWHCAAEARAVAAVTGSTASSAHALRRARDMRVCGHTWQAPGACTRAAGAARQALRPGADA